MGPGRNEVDTALSGLMTFISSLPTLYADDQCFLYNVHYFFVFSFMVLSNSQGYEFSVARLVFAPPKRSRMYCTIPKQSCS